MRTTPRPPRTPLRAGTVARLVGVALFFLALAGIVVLSTRGGEALSSRPARPGVPTAASVEAPLASATPMQLPQAANDPGAALVASPSAWYRVTAYNLDGVPGPPSSPYLTAPAWTPAPAEPMPAPVTGFVVRSGTQLLLDGKPFRFAGPNIYWLGLAEVPNVHYPSGFEVQDALATARLMGATVVRAHSLGYSTGCALCIEPARGQFNETALRHVDFALKTARDEGIRLILPLTDNSHYAAGGKRDYTTWRGLADERAFYSDPLVVADFEEFISVIANRVNTYTGVAYKDDPTILAWETGNELDAPVGWVDMISTYLKQLDPHHLVVDGNWGRNQLTDDLPLPNCDIYSIHGYPMSVADLTVAAKQTAAANKVFLLGEFGWNNQNKYGQPAGDPLDAYLAAIEAQPVIAGDLYWDLYPHDDENGYVQHNDEPGVNAFTLHYPGDTQDMRARAALLRAHAYRMQGQAVPPSALPAAPRITRIRSVNGTNEITWRGVAGADTYSVQRASAPSGPWTTVCARCATDNDTPWIDPTSGPAYAAAVTLDQATNYWRLDAGSGSRIHPTLGELAGVYTGTLTWNQDGALASERDPALGFDGKTAAVTFGNHDSFSGRQSFTLEIWVYPTIIDDSFRRIVSKETYQSLGSGALRAGYALSYSTPENGGLYFSRAAGRQLDEIAYQPGLPLNTWTYVVATYDGQTMALYLNGKLVATRPSNLELAETPVELTLGRRADGNDFFAGKLDELAIYASALTPNRIASHYHTAQELTNGR